MASVTQFYPCNNFAPYAPSTFKGSWNTNPSSTYITLADQKTGAEVTLLSQSAAASNNKIGIRACVSNPLEAQTISGTLDIAVNIQETNGDANFFTRVYLYVTQGDSNSVRGVLLDFADTGGTEWATTAFGTVYALSTPQALTPVVCTAGDRLVVEFGVQAVAGSGSSRTAQMWWGSTERFETGGILDDAVVAATGTGTTSASFIEFSNAVLVQRANAVEGDLIVGNRELYLYDGTTGALKRRVLPIGSSDPAGSTQLALDGTLYVSFESLNAGDDEENGQIAMYDPSTLEYQGLFQVFPGVGPHSLSPSLGGSLYAGFTGDGTSRASCGEATSGGPTPPVTPASAYLRSFDATGTLVDTFVAGLEDGGTNAIDLMSDQSTMLYTSLGREILAYDVVNDVQLPVWGTLPVAASGELARGLRILPDGSVLVVDKIDIKRLVAGTVTQTYTVAAQDDWGTIALSPDGLSFWVANRADAGVVPPMICKIEVSTGDVLVTISGEANVPDTEGGMCSGGINVLNGYRAALTGSIPSLINGPEALAFFEANGFLKAFDVPRVRTAPHLADEGERLFYSKFQLDIEAGAGTVTGQGVDPVLLLRYSNDGGFTWSAWRQLSVGALGQYRWRCIAWRLGMARDRVFQVRQTDPVKSAWLTAYLDFEDGSA